MPSFAFKATKWTLDLATTLIQADVRVHNAACLKEDMAAIFVVNHFTRLETLLLPYQIHKATGWEVWSLAAAELFEGRIGDYLRSTGNISTRDPDRDRIIVSSLLSGEHPWIIFPEGQMVKDKKVVGPRGGYQVNLDGRWRPPHTGAAALALRAEYYRHKLACLKDRPGQEGLTTILERFKLDSIDKALSKRTVIVPVNITYFPLRPRDNFMVRFARALFEGIDDRAMDELSVEGTLLAEDTDIDITLGEPIDVKEYLDRPEYSPFMACGEHDMTALETDPRSLFTEAVVHLMNRYMRAIYDLTTINYDHIFATLIRYQRARKFTERSYRNRIYLCVRAIRELGKYRLHQLLEETYPSIIYEDPSPKFKDFTDLCRREGWLVLEGDSYHKNFKLKRGGTGFHTVRTEQPSYVIANELEPLNEAVEIIKKIALAPRRELSERIRDLFLKEDLDLYDADYRKFSNDSSLPFEVGCPFLLLPTRPMKAGVVLIHGYLAAPAEVRQLGEYLCDKGYAVYGVRLRGHGTSPEDLAERDWREWYESVNRGYTIVKTLTDRIVMGGFSTGGALALYAAANKGSKVEAVFAVNAPLQLRRYAARFASSMVGMNNLLKRVRGESFLDYVENETENPEVNYTRNPVAGVRELGYAMEAMDKSLAQVTSPALLLQSSKDPVVHTISANLIFEKLGSAQKELTLFERDRHGIINGVGAEEVYDRIDRFLYWSQRNRLEALLEDAEEEVAVPEPEEASSALDGEEPDDGLAA